MQAIVTAIRILRGCQTLHASVQATDSLLVLTKIGLSNSIHSASSHPVATVLTEQDLMQGADQVCVYVWIVKDAQNPGRND